MSVSKRIATLSAALVADISGYEDGMNRAAKVTGSTEQKISQTMGKLEKVGLKLGLGLVGSGGALALLTGEIRNVIENIEKIPGVPASTIASIQQTRYAFQQSRETVDQAIAGVVSFTSWIARAAGFAAGALVYGLDAAEKGYWDFARAAETAAGAQERQVAAAKAAAEETAAGARIIAAANAAQDKTTTAQEQAIQRLMRARAAFEQKDETGLERLNRLKAEARAAQDIADAATKEGRASAASVNSRAEALEKLTEADKVEEQLVKVAQEHLKIWEDFYAMLAGEGADSPVEQLAVATKEASQAALDMGFAFQSAFEDAIIGGEKFSDVLKGLAQDILRIALRTAITAPLGKWIGGLFSGLFVGGGKAGSSIGAGLAGAFGGGKAGGGPVAAGTSYMVGEQGPELFTPRIAGHITPSGGQAGSTYYIDARGADRTGLARLEAMIRTVNGSIEHRALGAVMDFRRRGATFA